MSDTQPAAAPTEVIQRLRIEVESHRRSGWIIGGAFVLGLMAAFVPSCTRNAALQAEVAELETVQREVEQHLIGFTAYETHIAAARKELEGRADLLTAKVKREEKVTQRATRALFSGLTSDATVQLAYQVEYLYGFNLRADKFDLRATEDGLEIRVTRPILLGQPGMTRSTYTVLSGGVLVDEAAVINKLYQRIPAGLKKSGEQLASDPAIQALCEKELIGFVRAFLRKQPDVKRIPDIRVVYTS
ncbi:MAG: hypothetical protein RL026_810 [Pseudomonadota bacterium]